MQYFSIIFGVSLGFLAGGIIYENYGFKGASLLGSFFLGSELISVCIAFYIMHIIKKSADKKKKMQKDSVSMNKSILYYS